MPDIRSEKLFHIGIVTAIALGLYLTTLYSYLLFHSLIEITTIVIGFSIFILTWNARRFLDNDCLKLLGIGYAFIALIDLLHTLAYKGMNVFPKFDANLPTQLWIAARSLQAATLCIAPLFVQRRVGKQAIFVGYTVAVTLLVALVYSGGFPDCFVEGKGLTPFKIASEYVITVLLLGSLYLFYRIRAHFNTAVFFVTAASIVCTALSELSFTAYVSVYGFANLAGHFFKLAAFYLIYRALLVTGLKEPFDLIFRDLKQAEEALEKARDTLEEKVRERTAELCASEERYRSLIRKVQTAIVLHNGQGQILDSNPMAQELLCLSADQLLGKALIDPNWHFLREDGSVLPVEEYPASLVLSTGKPLKGQVTGICSPDRDKVSWVLVNGEPEYDEAGDIALVIVSFVDITARKSTEDGHRLNSQRIQTLLQLNQMTGATLKEITDYTLQEAVRLTQSKIGYLAFLNDDESVLTMNSWSKSAMEECAIAEKPILYPVESTGLWGEAVRQRQPIITNNYSAATPWKKGYPEGHVEIRRHMNVPVFEKARIVVVAGVGNKAEEYDQDDVLQLTLLMEGMWRLIERKRAEEELHLQAVELAEEVAERNNAQESLQEQALQLEHEIEERRNAQDELETLNESLEQRILERTADLAAKNAELERMNRIFVGRELRMIELKERIREMETKIEDAGKRASQK